jgi:hypothetical protein
VGGGSNFAYIKETKTFPATNNVLYGRMFWICAEFQFDGPTNTFNVWWDDMARPMLTSGPSKHASFTMPTFNGLWFGWWMYNLAEPQDIWIDEIAVDYKPIGCAK